MSMRPGRIWVPKIPDSRVITLVMWVVGIDPATGQPPPYDQATQWNDNWNALRKMFYTPKKQLLLTRRWKLDRKSPRIDTATAKVQLNGTMEPTMTGRTRATFAVDLVMADPYFYGPVQSTTIPSSVDVTLPTAVTMINPGDDTAGVTNMSVTLYGPLINPRLVNANGANGPIWVKLNGNVDSSTPVRLDISKFKATRLTTDPENVTSSISHSGATPWFALEPGENQIVLESDPVGPGGSAVITYQPPYL